MALKRGHRLSGVPSFPSVIAGRLASVSISTAEEFVSQTIGDPEPIRQFLGLDAHRFSDVVELAESVLDPETVEEMHSFRPKERSYGALNPHGAEYDSAATGPRHSAG
jgi:hypothetical protein